MKVLFGMILGAMGLLVGAAAAEYISKKKDEVDKVDEADNVNSDTDNDIDIDVINDVEDDTEDVVENDIEDDTEDDTDLYDDDDDDDDDEEDEPELFERVSLSVNDLDVPNVIKNRFRCAGLDRIPADVSQKELMEISGIGQNYANKVIDAVKKYQEETE